MRKKEQRLVITFSATTQAIKMEEICKKNNMQGRLIPVPKEITAGCGMAWSAKTEEESEYIAFMKKSNISYEGIFKIMI